MKRLYIIFLILIMMSFSNLWADEKPDPFLGTWFSVPYTTLDKNRFVTIVFDKLVINKNDKDNYSVEFTLFNLRKFILKTKYKLTVQLTDHSEYDQTENDAIQSVGYIPVYNIKVVLLLRYNEGTLEYYTKKGDQDFKLEKIYYKSPESELDAFKEINAH
jgi:hypothetical protein